MSRFDHVHAMSMTIATMLLSLAAFPGCAMDAGDSDEGEESVASSEEALAGCSTTPYAPFEHAGNLHAKAVMSCSNAPGGYLLHTFLQYRNSNGSWITFAEGYGPVYPGGAVADGYSSSWPAGYWRNFWRVEKNGVTQSYGSSATVWRSPFD